MFLYDTFCVCELLPEIYSIDIIPVNNIQHTNFFKCTMSKILIGFKMDCKVYTSYAMGEKEPFKYYVKL